MSQLLMKRDELRRQLMSNKDEIQRVLGHDPALAEYLMGDVELKRKYVKLPDQMEGQLAKASHDLGLAEGVLLGLGAALLIILLAEALAGNKKAR